MAQPVLENPDLRGAFVLPRLDVAGVLASLEAARAQDPSGLIATDADGTLWDGDVGNELFEALIAARGVRQEAREALALEARSIGMSDAGDANSLAVSLYAAYERNAYALERAFAMMAWAFAGWHQDEVIAFSERVLEAGNIDGRIRPSLRAIVRWAHANEVPLFVVSASPTAIVEAAVARLGIPSKRVAAMSPEVSPEGILTAKLRGPIVYGDGKLVALEAREPHAASSLLGAFGDSAYDAALLRAARVRIAVTPSKGLLEVAQAIPGLAVLSRDETWPPSP